MNGLRSKRGPSNRAVRIHGQTAPAEAWRSKGWVCSRGLDTDVYCGAFRVSDRRGNVRWYKGRIEVWDRWLDIFVHEPPAGIRRHAAGMRFTYTRDGWYEFIPRRTPAGIDAALVELEKVLEESLKAAPR